MILFFFENKIKKGISIEEIINGTKKYKIIIDKYKFLIFDPYALVFLLKI